MKNKDNQQKDTEQKAGQKIKNEDNDLQRGKTGQVGATTQSDKPGAKEGGETNENAGV